MKSKIFLRIISLLVLLVSLVPASSNVVRAAALVPPADMFQLPWEQGLAWVSLDVFDNGFKRPTSSPHYYLNGGAIDFAPRKNMVVGEDTSRYWVTAAAAGTVVSMTSCSLKIDHGNGWVSDYQFLAKFQVKVGDVVYRNQRLAIIADGVRYKFCAPALEPDIPHLHFSLRPNMRDATFAGWTVNYNPLFNRTTFTKGNVTVGQYQPLLNVFDGLQIVQRGVLPWDAAQTGSVDTYRYEQWSLSLSETTKFTLTATPNTANLVPLLILLDANGNELARSTGTLTSTQASGNYFVQVQPQVANGFYTLLAHKEDIPVPTGPYVSTTVIPTSINVDTSALVAVSLNNVPAEGYASAEFTCTYNAGLTEISNITVLSLFGAEPVYVVNGPQNGSFIMAIAGSNGNRATTDGNVFTFDIRGLQAGQTALECKARVSKGDNQLSDIEWLGTVLNITSVVVPTPTPGISPIPPTPTAGDSPTPTATSHFPPPTPTISPTMCNQAELTGYINIPPGTMMVPGSSWYQEWGLRNIGWCTWTLDYQLVFTSGDQMGSALAVGMPMAVAPGQLIVIRVPFVAPTALGHYASYWKLREPGGTQFGVGDSNNEPLVIDINVADPTTTPTGPTPSLSATPAPIESFTPTPTAATGICNQAEFIANITIPTGTVLQPGAPFRKTWRVQNVGTCDWTMSYQFVFFSGEQMSAPALIQFPANVLAGQTVDISIDMTAPSIAGSYQGNWMFKNASGTLFGTGQANRPLSVDIVVSTSTATPSMTPLPPANDWLTFTNPTYGFQFKYPPQGVIAPDGDFNFTRIDLPFEQGTNLREKYLEALVVENVDNCRSPLASSSMLETSDIININGIAFLKQTGGDAGAGNIHEWVAYSTRKDNACISFDFILHSLNAGNFPTPPPVFDYAAESIVFEQIVSTLTYLTQAPTATPTPFSTAETGTPFITPTPTGQGTVTGKVNASKPATVGLYNAGGLLVVSVATNPGDSFLLTAPSGTYSLVAVASGFLSAQGSVTLIGGATITQPTIDLIPGDIDNNNVIDQFDAMTIGMSYNTSTPAAADLNNDGTINVLDLEILAKNYRKTGPIAWQ